MAAVIVPPNPLLNTQVQTFFDGKNRLLQGAIIFLLSKLENLTVFIGIGSNVTRSRIDDLFNARIMDLGRLQDIASLGINYTLQ